LGIRADPATISKRTPLFNGPLECRLFRFEMVAGSARMPKPQTAA